MGGVARLPQEKPKGGAGGIALGVGTICFGFVSAKKVTFPLKKSKHATKITSFPGAYDH